MNIWVVIPAYNESQKIAEVITDLKENNFRNIVVIDDASADTTSQVAAQQGVHVLQHKVNRGQGAALATGTQYSLRNHAEIIVHFDADGQMQAKDIPALIKVLENPGVDVAIGSRFLGTESNIPALRKILLAGARIFNRVFLGITLKDPQSGFRAMKRKAAEQIKIKHDRMAHCSQMLHDMYEQGLTIQEVPVEIRYTEYSLHKGQSSLDAIKIVWDLLLGKIMKH